MTPHQSSPGYGASGNLLRLMLLLFPRKFRHRFGAEMVSAFLDKRDAITQSSSAGRMRTRLIIARLTATTALDFAASALAERFKQMRSRRARETSHLRRSSVLSNITSDLRLALRTLRKNPSFTFVVVVILAIGVGANTAMFSVMKTVFLEPLPFENAGRLALLWGTSSDGGYGTVSGPNFLDWREGTNTLEQMGAASPSSFNLTGLDQSERLNGAFVTASMFDVLGTRPAIGRVFLADNEQPGNTNVVVLSHGLWQRRFGADPDVVGRFVRINGESHEVVAVMPPGFDLPCPWLATERGDLWVPFPITLQRANRGDFSYLVLGRLREGATFATANEDLNAIARQLAEEYPASNEGRGVRVDRLHTAMFGSSGEQAILIFAAATLVLLIASSNVAGMQIGRGLTRQREVAVRTAIGASRTHVVRALLVETLVLSLVGGVAGVILAYWGIAGLRLVMPSTMPSASDVALDIPALGFGLAISVLAGLAFGLIPCLTASRADIRSMLGEGGWRSSGEGRKQGRFRSRFVVAQLALGLVLLNCGALLVRSYGNLRGTDQGFDQDHVLTMAVSLTGPEYDDVAERFTYFEDAKQTLATLPAVHHVGVTNKLPLRGGSNARTRSEDQPPRSGPVDGVLTEITPVIPDYFEAIGIPFLAGRTPTLEDTVSAHYGAVINQSLAGRLWPGQNPIGRRFTFDEDPPAWLTVVGVVGDVRQWGAEREPIPEAFTPYTFFPLERMYLTLGVDGDPAAVAGAARQRLFEIDPDSPTFQVRTMADVLHASFERRRFYTFMTGLFAMLAVVLAAVGVFGVLSQYVAQRTHEIGLRAALGAARTEVLRLVVGRTLRMFAVGLAVGLIGMVMSRRLLARMLYEVGGWDLAAIAVTVGVLAIVALMGSVAPALRATRVSPVVALRAE